MRLSEAAVRRFADSVPFQHSAAPYLLLDADLNIRGANRAYERATLHRAADMVSEYMFEVFPDNPETPQAASVANLESSFAAVLRHCRPDRMAMQRYDVRDPSTGRFVDKNWLPVNSPVLDADGRVIAILHHVEDVSRMVMPTSLERLLSARGHSSAGMRGDILEPSDLADDLLRDAGVRRQTADRLVAQSDRLLRRTVRARFEDL